MNQNDRHLIVGLTGMMACGKGEIAAYLSGRGFRAASLSDIVRQEVARKAEEIGRPLTRSEMQDIGNGLRREHGPAVLAERVADRIRHSGWSHWVVDGIRNPAEVMALRALPGFVLLGVECETATAIRRIRSRKRDEDLQASDEELLKRLKRELGEGEPPEGQQVGACLRDADHRIINNQDSLEHLHIQIEGFLEEASLPLPKERRIAVYPGSSDPMTRGHLDIIRRGLPLFDRIIVAVLKNTSKQSLFSTEERVDILRQTFATQPQIEVDAFDGLLVDYVQRRGATCIVRGLRAISDFEGEFQMALMNRRITPDCETLFMVPSICYSFVSSRLVKEVYQLGGEMPTMVTPLVDQALKARFGAR